MMQRLILFDVDGTLLTTDGAARRAFHRALLETYGTAGPIDDHDFAGKTDPQIARELLRAAGLAAPVIERELETLWSRYVRHLEVELDRPGDATRALAGAAELLDALERSAPAPAVGLLTGNIERGAALKLGAAGLDARFAFGAYGSDSRHRPDLPAVAVERAREAAGTHFRGPDIVILGDTPHDVTCGRELGVRAVGVATGGHESEALVAAGAEVVLDDLADTERAMDVLLSAGSTAPNPP